MEISADPQYNMEWHKCWPQEEGGTNLYLVYTLFDRTMDQLDVDRPGRSCCFTMDNLNIHHSQMLLQVVEDRGHRYLFQSPYWSVDGLMEYFFSTVHVFLLTYFRSIRNIEELENRLDVIIAQLGFFLEYFLHVWFPDN